MKNVFIYLIKHYDITEKVNVINLIVHFNNTW